MGTTRYLQGAFRLHGRALAAATMLMAASGAAAQVQGLWVPGQNAIYLNMAPREPGETLTTLVGFRTAAGGADPEKAQLATTDAIALLTVTDLKVAATEEFGTIDVGPVGQTCIEVKYTSGSQVITDWNDILTLTVIATDQFGASEPISLRSLQGAASEPVDIGDCNESPPVAVDDAVADIEEGSGPVSLDVLANDVEPTPAGPLSITSVQLVAGGGNVTNNGSSISYNPLSYTGPFEILYQISGSGFRSSNPGVVTGAVVAQNDPPQPQPDSATTQGEPVTIDVLANDSDPDGDSLSIVGVTQGANGTVTHDGATVTYVPGDFTGRDTFTYSVSDGTATVQGVVVTVEVGGTNQPPEAADDSASGTAGEDITIDVLANDSDPDGDPLSIGSVTGAANGTVTHDGSAVTYTPDVGFSGEDTFSYTATDGVLTDTATVIVTVEPLDDVPVARDDTASAQEDGSVTISVLGNDLDPEGNALTIATVTQPANGTVTVASSGLVLVYRPNAGFSGTDSFSYTVTDGTNESAPATVTVTVEQRFRIEDVATNPNQASIGRAVDEICPRLNSIAGSIELTEGQADLLAKCNNLLQNSDNPSEQRAALDAIAGEEISAQQTTGIDYSSRQLSNIASRVIALRRGTGGGMSVAGLNITHDGRQIPLAQLVDFAEHLLAGGGGASGDEPEEPGGLLGRRLGIFLNGNIISGDKDRTAAENEFDFDSWGLTLGFDYRFTDNFVAGLAAGYNESETSFADDAGGLDGDGFSGSLYGTYFTDRLHVDFIGNVGSVDYDSTRRIVYSDAAGTNDLTAVGATDGDVTSAALSFGYDFHRGGWTFGPTLGLDMIQLDVDPFEETGAGGLDLAYGEQEAESTTVQGGFRFSYAWSRTWGIVSPHARLAFVKELENDSEVINVHFVHDPFVNDPNSPSPGITIITDEPDEEYVRWGVGLSAVFGNGISTFVDYETYAGYSGVSLNELSFGIRFERAFR